MGWINKRKNGWMGEWVDGQASGRPGALFKMVAFSEDAPREAARQDRRLALLAALRNVAAAGALRIFAALRYLVRQGVQCALHRVEGVWNVC
eukprot:364515-Chlamydomonas_euryale.AAC.11